jgi:hypothetical protein
MQAHQGWCGCTKASACTDYLLHRLQLNMNTLSLHVPTTGVMLSGVHKSRILRADT